MRELDVKLDDGIADTGDVRATESDAGTVNYFGGTNSWSASGPNCTTTTTTTPTQTIWDVANDSQDCNAVYLY